MKIRKEEILEYLKLLKPELEEVGIIKIGLFGSYARGEEHIGSDVDIAIARDKTMFSEKVGLGFSYIIYIEDLKERISKDLKRLVDIYDSTNLPKDQNDKILKDVVYV